MVLASVSFICGSEEYTWIGAEWLNDLLNHDHSVALQMTEDLTIAYRSSDQSEKEQQYRRALKDKENSLGFNHADTLTSLSNLASVFLDQGRYKAAEEMNRRALEGRERVLGKDHPDTLMSMNSLTWFLER